MTLLQDSSKCYYVNNSNVSYKELKTQNTSLKIKRRIKKYRYKPYKIY
jgi:hypothetical protein